MQLKRILVGYDEIVLVYRNGKLVRALREGVYWLFSWSDLLRFERLSLRSVAIVSPDLDQIVKSDFVAGIARCVDLADGERALVWVDGRFEGFLLPGRYGYWTVFNRVEIEVVDAASVRFVRKDLPSLLQNASASRALGVTEIPEGSVGALYVDGALREVLPAGTQAFWKHVAKVRVQVLDLREQVLDVTGQDIMTQDKVTLRLNAVLTYRVTDVSKLLETVVDAGQALYRDAQLVLRSQVGNRSLDALLSDKQSLADAARSAVAGMAAKFGVEVLALGIRDLILPGDMKTLLNQVIEAQKAAEANSIKRREETAAMRSQLNTAKLIESNPTLMRLRELEVLESVARTTNLQVVLGDGNLSERLTKLI